MSKKIKKLFIKDLLGKKNIFWELSDDVNVLVGKNGAGKSSILNIIKSLISGESGAAIAPEICAKAEVLTGCGDVIGFKTVPKNLEESIKRALSLFSERITSEKKLINGYNKKRTILTKDMIQKFENDILKEFFLEIPMSSTKINIDENEYIGDGSGSAIEKFIDEERRLPFEYISTINMNANSLNEINSSDGKKTTILDMEIEKEISRLNDLSECSSDDEKSIEFSCKSKEIKKCLIKTVNEMLIESDKKMVFANEEITFNTITDDKSLKLSQLSSGERQLVYTLIKSAIAAHNDAILLMDEPEISLHPSWQEVLISKIREINKAGQIIIVTHSPAIVMNGWMSTFIDIEDIETQSNQGVIQ